MLLAEAFSICLTFPSLQVRRSWPRFFFVIPRQLNWSLLMYKVAGIYSKLSSIVAGLFP